MKKKTKVIASALTTIALCLSLAVGGTFALFTSESKVDVNIATGTVNVEAKASALTLYSPTSINSDGSIANADNAASNVNKTFANGGTAALEGGTITLERMTAGDKATFDIKVTNNSNVKVKYQTKLEILADNGLFAGLTVKLTKGEETTIYNGMTALSNWYELQAPVESASPVVETTTVTIELPAGASNDYQGKTCKLAFTVNAVQGNVVTDNPETGVVYIYNANDLKLFAASVNNGTDYAGKTVKLMDNIDLNGANWTPIGTNADGNKFKGTFDGNYKTISNLKVNTADEIKYQATGFFGALNGVAKNFTINGATIIGMSKPNAEGSTDNGIAVVAGSIYTSGSIEGVTVKNATVTGNRYVAGISGYTYGSVKNCIVENISVTATPDNLTGSYDNGDKAGAVVGTFWHENTHEISGNRATNVTVKGYRDLGGIVGFANGNVTGNTVNGLTLIQDYSILTTPRTTVEPIVGRHDGYEVDASNTYDNVTTTRQITVATAAKLSEVLNATYNQDITIVLANDIDLTGVAWGVHTLEGTNNAALTIDGNGKTISGLTSITYTDVNGFNSNGLVTAIKSSLSSVTFKNLTVSGANLTNNGGGIAASGVFVGDINTVKVTFENCTVTGATVTSSAYAAGFIGYVQDVYVTSPTLNCPVTLKDCIVTGSTFNGGDATGAMIGLNNGATIINGATVTGNTINGGAGYSAAALVGTSISNTTATNVTASGNTFAITNNTGYQVNHATYGYIYKNDKTYSVNESAL